jgi:hypothetical protein
MRAYVLLKTILNEELQMHARSHGIRAIGISGHGLTSRICPLGVQTPQKMYPLYLWHVRVAAAMACLGLQFGTAACADLELKKGACIALTMCVT